MRAEDFFGYAKKMAEVRADLEKDLSDVDRDYQGRSALAKSLAQMPYQGQIGAIKRSYGEGLDSNSHGEGFLKLFQERFSGEGLYLLDEPEAPLSPSRQLSFLALMHRMVGQNGQFIIATHSPIIMAYPGAKILSFDGGKIHEERYADLEHVTLTRDFLNHPEAFLRHLME
jgi:predicted ATPase